MLGGVVVLLSLSESSAQNTYTLEACQTLALQNNKRIAIAKIDQQVATQEVKSAKTGRTPTATASGNGIYFLEGAGGLIPEQLLTFGVSVTQPIYLGGKVRNGIEAAGIGEKLASEQQALVEDEVIYQTQEY
ncbi:MAG: TolC family protein, partial [Bacteroidota bacterium]